MKRLQPGFTKRARCLLAAGAAAMVCGAVIGEQELVRGGAFAMAVPIVAAIVVGRERLTISSSRQLEPSQISIRGRAIVQISITSRSALPTSTLMLEDTLPAQATGRARFVLDHLSPHQSRSVGYRLPALGRGEHLLGPLHIRLTDPFGLIDRSRSFTARSTLLVTPEIEPLPGGAGTLQVGFGDGVASNYIGHNGVDDLSTREYRVGDDLRRIHWRLTARAGTLMVRQDEQPAPSDITLVLDLRAAAHAKGAVNLGGSRTIGNSDDLTDTDSFEWLVSAAASIGDHLIRGRRPVSVVDSPRHGGGIHFATSQEMLHYLSLVQPRHDVQLTDLVDFIAGGTDRSMIVALLAGLTSATAEQIIGHSRSRTPALGVVIDTQRFARSNGLTTSDSAIPLDERGELVPSAELEHSCSILRTAGWTVVVAQPGQKVADVWTRLLAQRAIQWSTR